MGDKNIKAFFLDIFPFKQLIHQLKLVYQLVYQLVYYFRLLSGIYLTTHNVIE